MQNGYAIAIDGPVAAGKGTVATLLAEKLHGFHLYTGAFYRCLALYCLENQIPKTNSDIINSLKNIRFDIDNGNILLNSEDVTEKIKQRVVTSFVPVVAAIQEVREEMVKRQREIGMKRIADGKIVIAEGRDAATKIFPDARLKIFLTASSDVRAKRRFYQMGGNNNETISFGQILEDTISRDKIDTERSVDPLVKNPEKHGYFVLDDTFLTEDETLNQIFQELKKEHFV